MKDKLTFAQECSLIANGEDTPYQLPRDTKFKHYRITYIDLKYGYKHEYYTETKNMHKALKKARCVLKSMEVIKVELLEK